MESVNNNNNLIELEECLSSHSLSSLDSFWENIFTDDDTVINVDNDQYMRKMEVIIIKMMMKISTSEEIQKRRRLKVIRKQICMIFINIK